MLQLNTEQAWFLGYKPSLAASGPDVIELTQLEIIENIYR